MAAVSSSLNWDEQLWRIEPTSDGYYRLINKARGTALQMTGEKYGYWPDVGQVSSTPSSWNGADQKFRLLPD